MKHLLMDNTGSNGNLDCTEFMKAILQYRNTPDTATGISPAMYVFHKPIRDFLPDININESDKNWKEVITQHQKAREQHLEDHQPRLHEHTRRLPPLQVGNKVLVQNQNGNFSTKWDNTGDIMEVRQFDQYLVKLDHSGRCSLRNRRYLRKLNQQNNISYQPATPEPQETPIPPTELTPTPEEPSPTEITGSEEGTLIEDLTNQVQQNKNNTRRSSRNRKPPDRLTYGALGSQTLL